MEGQMGYITSSGTAQVRFFFKKTKHVKTAFNTLNKAAKKPRHGGTLYHTRLFLFGHQPAPKS